MVVEFNEFYGHFGLTKLDAWEGFILILRGLGFLPSDVTPCVSTSVFFSFSTWQLNNKNRWNIRFLDGIILMFINHPNAHNLMKRLIADLIMSHVCRMPKRANTSDNNNKCSDTKWLMKYEKRFSIGFFSSVILIAIEKFPILFLIRLSNSNLSSKLSNRWRWHLVVGYAYNSFMITCLLSLDWYHEFLFKLWTIWY